MADLTRQDHLIVYPRTATHLQARRGTQAQISLILAEPSEFHQKHLTLLRLSWWRFFRVLSFNEALLARIPNGVFFPLGGTWVPEWRSLPGDKTQMTSLIASSKKKSMGHRLRHRMASWVVRSGQNVDVLGRGYQPFEAKAEGLAPYHFSVVIENVQEKNYFSEKLVDAVLCKTVPIYWGCPNLDRFMNPTGVIQCASEADLRQAVERASVAEYERLLPGLLEMQSDMAEFGDVERRAAKAVQAALGGQS